MPGSGEAEITLLLAACQNGDAEAAERLAQAVYQELRLLARSLMRRERPDHTLQPTALVHEVYLRLFGKGTPQFSNRTHFFIVAAQTMRRVLVDHARRVQAARRAAGQNRMPLDELIGSALEPGLDLVALDDALRDLERLDKRVSQVVELRYFGGLTIEETAEVLGLSPVTIRRDWKFARTWLGSLLGAGHLSGN